MINRKLSPTIHDAISFPYYLPSINKDTLSNNIPLYWLNAGTQEVVQIEWIFDAGLWFETQTAVAQSTAALLKNGTTSRNALQINEAVEYCGASLRISPNNDYTIVTLHTLTKHLPELLPVIKDIITEATFPEEELRIYIQNAKQRLAVNLRQSEFVANRHIDATLFGKEHPYGRYAEAADLDKINRKALIDFYRKHYHSGNCRIFMAGKVDAAHVNLINAYFGKENWGNIHNAEHREHATTPSKEHISRIINDENAVQGAVRIACNFPTRQHPDFSSMIVLNTLFGGYFGSRLMANIREDKGFTYGIYSRLYNYKHDGALLIATEAGRNVCEQTVEEVYKEMDLLCHQPVSEDELLLVKNYILGNTLGDLDGPFQIMQHWKNIILNDLPTHQFDIHIETCKTVNPTQLLALAQKYFCKENYYELVVV
jgi:predicted Zn-dependent peptidase